MFRIFHSLFGSFVSISRNDNSCYQPNTMALLGKSNTHANSTVQTVSLIDSVFCDKNLKKHDGVLIARGESVLLWTVERCGISETKTDV